MTREGEVPFMEVKMLFSTIDDATIVNWVVTSIVVGVPTIIGAIWAICRKLISLITPPVQELWGKLVNGVDAHKDLVKEMRDNVPVVANTLEKMSNTMDQLAMTQDGQFKAIERLDLKHSDHSMKLDEILKSLKEERCKTTTASKVSSETG